MKRRGAAGSASTVDGVPAGGVEVHIGDAASDAQSSEQVGGVRPEPGETGDRSCAVRRPLNSSFSAAVAMALVSGTWRSTGRTSPQFSSVDRKTFTVRVPGPGEVDPPAAADGVGGWSPMEVWLGTGLAAPPPPLPVQAAAKATATKHGQGRRMLMTRSIGPGCCSRPAPVMAGGGEGGDRRLPLLVRGALNGLHNSRRASLVSGPAVHGCPGPRSGTSM